MQPNYPENVIVTVRMNARDLEEDVRLAADALFEHWLPELVGVLNQWCKAELDPRKLIVRYNGKMLQPNDTLASLGAWDGSVLQLEER